MRTSLSALGVASLAGSAAAFGLWAPPASAAQQGATAEVPNGSVIEYRAAVGQVNEVTVTDGTERLQVVIDDVVPIEAGAGCTHPDEADATRVMCTITADPEEPHLRVELFLDDGDDTLDAGASVWQVVHGGAGDDVLTDSGGSLLYNEFNGDDGDDTITGAEWQIGGGGSDTLTGTDRDDNLNGQWGNDTIHAGDGADWLKGAAGDDELHAGAGNDSVHGNAGNDTMFGDAGDDVLEGGQGTDQIDGGTGDDVIHQD
ncbi:calcium-binding protein [Streptomyces sp. 6N223]|uniref:calcium-binding protein n=1 Tax=Streptomyces sp. 6N223 TaxID=3457412 RepID=UPI003FD2B542